MREMRGTIMRVGASGAGVLLALGLLIASPAGASGSDRDGESERSVTADCFDTSGKTQGRSHSDPDGMSNGGPDKPGCLGGFDADKDGNNGCGNDADREDDNNGNCGRKPAGDKTKKAPSDSTTTTTATTTTTTLNTVRDAGASVAASGTTPVGTLVNSTGVTGSDTSAGSGTDPSASTAGDTGAQAGTTATEPQTEVLGETLERPSVLARTGAGVGGLALLGGLLCGGGRLAVLARRFLRIN